MISLIAELISMFTFIVAAIQYTMDKYDFTSWTFTIGCAIMAMLVAIRYEKE